MGRRGIRIGATVGIAAALWETYRVASTTGDPMKQIVQTWTGWDGQNWDWRKAKALVAAGAGCAVSYVAAKTGINRYTPTRINL